MIPRSDAVTRHETIYSTPTDRELVITRTFDAPRSLVWTVFTDAKHVPNWHIGPAGFTMPICEIDLRPGGVFRYVWRTPQGREFTATGVYREIDPPKRLVYATSNNGHEQTSTTTFTEEDGRTTVTVELLFPNKTVRDQGIPYAKVGTEANYARLDEYLAAHI